MILIGPNYRLDRLPETDEELWWAIRALWGVTVPNVQVCPDHTTPFQALADAYFARSPVVLWHASRGFGGKSFLLATLALTEAALLGAEVTVLGGSAAQSQNVHNHSSLMWHSPTAPKEVVVNGEVVPLLKEEPTTMRTRLRNHGSILALMASQKSVRGPHPQRLRLDEIDEMELAILEAAQGQPMSKRGISTQTVMSSTWQYADGTYTEMTRRARDRDWPIMRWCYRETSAEPNGWLGQEDIERKRAEVSEIMFSVEYDLQEPAHDSRAIQPEFVEAMFDPKRGVYEGAADERLIFHEPEPEGAYMVGVDWAKEADWTVMMVWDTRQRPWELVAFLRTGRKSWPRMVADLQSFLELYGSNTILVHDATGIGNVIDDLIDWPRHLRFGLSLRGADRESAHQEFVAGIEQGQLRAPRIQSVYDDYRLCSQADLFGSGHPPDSFVAGCMAWSRRRQTARLSPKPFAPTRQSPWRIPGELNVGPSGMR